MPTFFESIRDFEEDLLVMIAGQWGLEEPYNGAKDLAGKVAAIVEDKDEARDFLESITDEDLAAIRTLSSNNGRIPWPQFERSYGALREMGPARRKRERPDLNPVSVSESLFYKGLIGKGFLDASGGPREFAFLPDEISAFFDAEKKRSIFESLETIPEGAVRAKILASDSIIDHSCTALAAIRTGIPLDTISFTKPDIPPEFLKTLSLEANLISSKGELKAANSKSFLEASRADSLSFLFNTWAQSSRINDLVLLCSVQFEKSALNDPLRSRSMILEMLRGMPDHHWFSTDEFIAALHGSHPDIIRRGGEYDAWIIKDRTTGEFLAGFENWQEVEGSYLRKLVRGPLNWLGILELGTAGRGGKTATFRKSPWADRLFAGQPLKYQTLESNEFILEKNGQVLVDRYFPRHIRYQIARFCEWTAQKGNRYEYRLTAASLERSRKQGLKVSQFLSLVKKYAKNPIPANIPKALNHWEKDADEITLSNEAVIRVKSPRILDHLMSTPAAKYIRKRLSPEAAIVEENGISFIKAELLANGYLPEVSGLNKD